jgi:hypothetical protein
MKSGTEVIQVNAIQGDLDAIISDPIASIIVILQRFKFVR